MTSRIKHWFWLFANWYGNVFGRARLAGFHHAILILALHGLGYDNARNSGEEWFVSNILKKYRPKVCVDVGANVGNYSKLLLTLGCKVYAFEPAKDTFAELEKIDVIAIRKAVGEKSETAKLFSAGHSETRSLHSNVLAARESETVEVVSLDDAIQETIDFVKIDTEGHEYEVLLGMKKHRPKLIQFEFNIMHLKRGHTLLTLTSLLQGYNFYRLLPHGWIAIDPKTFSNNIFMFCNIVAVRRDS